LDAGWKSAILSAMPDGLYELDALAWSQHQADLLRRLGRGERVNDIDWAHVAEEIEDVGLSELHSVESFLDLIIVHLLKVRVSPDSPDSPASTHWRQEVVAFQKNARRRFTPSMRQRIDVENLYREAIEEVRAGTEDGAAHRAWPDANPFTLDDLLTGDHDTLLARLADQRP
jgi:hypothetical protein